MGMPAPASPAVVLRGIAKAFGGVAANRDASLEAAAGEIHAVVGENGAGKSTLMRVLAGGHAPDAGTVLVHGRDVTGWDTRAAIAAGVGMVHQHFMLVPTLTVAENVVLGAEPMARGRVDLAAAVAAVAALSRETGLAVDPTALVADLTVGEAQRVEILKALHRGARVLILDEPTAVLSPPEVADLWRVLRTLAAGGATIVLITHKLDEVVAVSDTITVLRDGRTVARFPTAGTTPQAIARAMVGRDVTLALDALALDALALDALAPHAPAAGDATADDTATPPVLACAAITVRGDRGHPAVRDLTLAVRPGEIVGIAGVEGNGQAELVEAIAGLRPLTGGAMRLAGRDLAGCDVAARAALGISHIPEDRQRRGLLLDFSITDNLLLGQAHRAAGRLGLDRRRAAAHAALQVARFDIRPPDPSLPVRALSGGNQQKVVVAREVGRPFALLLAAQPTRGVDVGAIEFIHAQLRAARDAGKGVLLVSADLAEVLALADRVGVMYGGRLVALLPRAACAPELLGRFMTGAEA
jgi:simple sugar transport system ATP-binding protein